MSDGTPHDPLGAQVAHFLLSLPQADRFALAGAAGLQAHDVVERRTEDLDLFTTDPQQIAAALDALRRSAEEHRWQVDVVRQTPSFARLQVRSDERTVWVDLAHDAETRRPVGLAVGRVRDLDELAADKVLALFGRGYPRDLADVDRLLGRYGRLRPARARRRQGPRLRPDGFRRRAARCGCPTRPRLRSPRSRRAGRRPAAGAGPPLGRPARPTAPS